jgi:hypothetical protein
VPLLQVCRRGESSPMDKGVQGADLTVTDCAAL